MLDHCLQLHGGYGYMNEYVISRLWRDARVQRIYGGTNEVMREIVGPLDSGSDTLDEPNDRLVGFDVS